MGRSYICNATTTMSLFGGVIVFLFLQDGHEDNNNHHCKKTKRNATTTPHPHGKVRVNIMVSRYFLSLCLF